MAALPNIIFLDEHGVVISRDALMSNTDYHKSHEELVDPVAVRLINHLALITNALIVATSSVRRNYTSRDGYKDHLDRMGVDGDRLAEDWETCRTPIHRLTRTNRIQGWLDRNDGQFDKAVILDDIAFDFAFAVQTNAYKGFQINDLNAALAILGSCIQYMDDSAFQSDAPVWERYPHACAKPTP